MSDYFSFRPICKKCSFDLSNDETHFDFMMPVGHSIDLKCPKCGTTWRFWIGVKAYQKKLKNKSKSREMVQ